MTTTSPFGVLAIPESPRASNDVIPTTAHFAHSSPDILVPQARLLGDEVRHRLNALCVVQHGESVVTKVARA